jgi:hypothetical protein
MNIKISESLEEGEQLLQHKEANEEESRLSTTIKNHHCRIKLTLCLLIINGCFLALVIFGLAPVWVPQNSKICDEKRYCELFYRSVRVCMNVLSTDQL